MQKIKAEFNTLFEYFDLNFTKTSIILSNLLQQDEVESLESLAEQILTKIESRLALEIDGWLEEELKMNLLSPILFLADINEPQKIGVFLNARLPQNLNKEKSAL
jgi:hypothetical protein